MSARIPQSPPLSLPHHPRRFLTNRHLLPSPTRTPDSPSSSEPWPMFSNQAPSAPNAGRPLTTINVVYRHNWKPRLFISPKYRRFAKSISAYHFRPSLNLRLLALGKWENDVEEATNVLIAALYHRRPCLNLGLLVLAKWEREIEDVVDALTVVT